jgi:hypothetical protein
MASKTKRTALITQNFRCAFCDSQLDCKNIPCYHAESGTCMCRKCILLVSNLMGAVNRMGSFQAVARRWSKFTHINDQATDELADSAQQALEAFQAEDEGQRG